MFLSKQTTGNRRRDPRPSSLTALSQPSMIATRKMSTSASSALTEAHCLYYPAPAPVTGSWRTGAGFAGKAESKPAPEPEPEPVPVREMTSINAPNIQTLEQATTDIAESVKGISAKIAAAGGWGDYMMETDSDDEEEELDHRGRPLDDNSAW